jgi:type IV secretion system protein VirD4
LVNGNPNTVLSFISTADTALTALASPEITRLTAKTTFDSKSLRKRPTVLYVKVNEQDVDFYRFILNLFFTDLFGVPREHLPQEGELDVFCLLDEFGQLKLPDFDNVIARKYRVGAMIFLQSLAQLEELCLNLGDALHQAARFSASSVASTPSLNLVPSMTFGNWFLPLRRSHFFDAA